MQYPCKSPRISPAKARATLWGVFFLLAAALLIFGLARGEAAVVLKKGIRVCLECIGIG